MGAGQFPLEAFAGGDLFRLTVLHTNDMHSRIDPFPADDKKYAGLGGMAQRAAIIQRIRAEEEHVLLLDCGDIFQGTPYFNFFGGETELKLMSAMGYDAATMGNHDFDGGIEGFDKQLPHANFPFLVANYDLRNTVLKGKVKTHAIFNRGPLKIGVFGLGIELSGLVPDKLYGETIYQEPISVAQQLADMLRYDERCDIVVCLSHLGYKYQSEKVSDELLATQTSGIDLILGGHTHTFLPSPVEYKNRAGEMVVVNQVGWGGIVLGRLEIICDKVKRKKWRYVQPVIVS
jgi:5'-nucleotidase